MKYEKDILKILLDRSNYMGNLNKNFPSIPQYEVNAVANDLENRGLAIVDNLSKASTTSSQRGNTIVPILKLTPRGIIYAKKVCNTDQ